VEVRADCVGGLAGSLAHEPQNRLQVVRRDFAEDLGDVFVGDPGQDAFDLPQLGLAWVLEDLLVMALEHLRAHVEIVVIPRRHFGALGAMLQPSM